MSPSLNPPQPPDPPSPDRRKQHGAIATPLRVPLGSIGVAIVDDDENVHLLVRDILDRAQEFQWVGSYSSGEAALAGIPQSGVQIVLMDIKMPDMSGSECTRRLKALLPHVIIVMVTGLGDPRTINLTRQCGADRCLPKPFTAAHVLATLSFCIPRPEVKIAKPEPSGKASGHRGRRGRPLTARENRVMDYLAEGYLYKEIADRTGVSESAVHHMLSRIFKKLGVMNRTEAILQWKNGNRRSPSV